MKTNELEVREHLLKTSRDVFKTHNKVLCKFSTGAGKTKVALTLASETDEDWTLLVPRTPLFKTWNDEMIQWNLLNLGKKVEMKCYASAHTLEDNTGAEGKNIILDEVHRVTERSLPYIKAYLGNSGKLICLSATVPLRKKLLLASLGIGQFNTVSYALDAAVADNLVTDYSIQVVQVALNNKKQQFKGGQTEQAAYDSSTRAIINAKYSTNPEAVKWARITRMRFIYNLPSKLELAIKLLKEISPDKRVMIFCGSILHANAVCKYRYHSKTDTTHYDLFCAGEINQIAVVQSVAEGVNISILDTAIIMQVQSEDLHTIQKIGRSLRKDPNNPDKVGHIIILEAVNTQDSYWVGTTLKSFDQSKIEYLKT